MANFFSRLFKSKPQRTQAIDPISDTQRAFFEMLQQGIGGEGPLAGALGGFDPEQISQFFQTGVGDPARKQFFERTAPGLQQRAAASGLSRSSGLQRMIEEQQGDLEGQLSALLAQQQMGARESALDRQLRAAGIGTQAPQQQIGIQPGRQSVLQGLLQGAASGLGQAAGSGLAGFLR